ncbi:MAG: metallophosphoesterase family protein [Bryobacteraceae bacterium]
MAKPSRLWLAVTFGVLLGAAYVTQAQRDGKIPEAELHRPTAAPDRIILTWSGDPAVTQSVTWRTSAAVERAVAQIAEAEDGPGFTAKARDVPASTQAFHSDLGDARYHSVTFRELQPATLYAYRVGDGFNWSEWNQFRTASATAAPLAFLYVGDAQNDIFSLWSRLVRQGFTIAPDARFLIHAGDLVNRGPRDAEWGEWHRAAGWINHSMVSLPVPGNHEYAGDAAAPRALTAHWRPQFTLPENGPAGVEESSYYVDVQGVRIVGLNSNEKRAEQAAWLDGVLANNPNRWTVLAFHHPIFSTAKGRDNKELRDLWQPIFDKYAVDMVLTGHDHTYGRTNLVTGAPTRSGKSGTVYVVSVSGPKMYNLDAASDFMQRRAEDTQLFQVIRINGNRLSFESRTARGVLYDAFEIEKRKGRANRLINRTPRTPERRKAAPQPSPSARDASAHGPSPRG